MSAPSIHVYPNPSETALRAAQFWLEAAHRSIAARNAFRVALSGGASPKALFEQLTTDTLKNKLDWSKVWVYFGDERCVAQDHNDSNYRMAKESLLDLLPINPAQVFPLFAPSKSPEQNAADYEAGLSTLGKNADGTPVLDLIMLGMGPDGHTASLFPDTKILTEQDSLIAAVFVPKLNAWRVSFTFPLINAAREILFLATGASKKEMLQRVFAPIKPVLLLPVEMLRPEGEVHWFIDQEANPA